MPELTPLDDNRQEHFLNGEDLEPITRREHFYAGREGELPEGHQEPETREEWFIKKYRGGGGGDITVESLSVTSNGTYTAPSGKAYSPVEVDVPLPENAYLLKSVTTPTPIASFTDGEEMVMPSLKVAIEPVQSGSGDPSPTNIRPISGWSEANVTVADDVETPTVSNVYTIDLNGTRYGGELDVVSGIMTVKRVGVDMATLNWTNSSSNHRSYCYDIKNLIKIPSSQSAKSGCIAEKYFEIPSIGNLIDGEFAVTQNGDLIFYYDGVNPPSGKLVYPLATPLTIQLTPTQVKSLLGQNNIWADTGDITDAEYFSKEV